MKGLTALSLVAVAALACSDSSSTEPPPLSVTDSLVVDASQTAFVRLGTPAQVVNVANATTSSEWDLSFSATTVTLNGGAAGPSSASGHCVCARANATDEAIRALTPALTLPDFTAVTAAGIPDDGAFRSDQLAPAISAWFSGTGAAATPFLDRSWFIREGTGTVVLAKFRITGLQQASAANAGQISFEFAVQPAPGTPFGPVHTRTVDVRTGPVYFDLTTGTVTSSTNWDLRFDGWTVRTNGGVSGSGTIVALVEMSRSFEQVDAAYASTAPAQAYRRDSYSGVFAQQPWYRYNITGTDNQIWPTFNVYLVKRGAEVYKVQLTGYYGPAGEARRITLRYARLR